MIRLYGSSRSRAARCLWMLEEIGIAYEHRDLEELEAGDKLVTVTRVNPIGKVPALEDGDIRLFESMAINLYLAARYGGDLWPDEPGDQGRATAWSIWGMTETEPPLAQLFFERVIKKDKDTDEEAAAVQTLRRPLIALESHLEKSKDISGDYLLGRKFTVADLNLASVLTLMNRAHFELDDYPGIRAWRERCSDRDAYRKVYPARPVTEY